MLAEIVSAPWSGTEENWVHTIEAGVEEALELAGWILVAGALTVAAWRRSLRPRPEL